MVSHLACNHSHILVGDTICAEEVGEKRRLKVEQASSLRGAGESNLICNMFLRRSNLLAQAEPSHERHFIIVSLG
jgi:hypothetical protein